MQRLVLQSRSIYPGRRTILITTKLAKKLLHLISWLPLRANHALGASIGWLVNRKSIRNKDVVLRNVQLCFPHLTGDEHTALTRNNLNETGKNITELGPFWFWDQNKVAGLVVEQIGRDVLDNAKAQSKGVIIASPHFGAWELAGLILSLEAPIHFLYRPNRNTSLDEPVIASRERFGGKCHPITGRGLGSLVRALKKGQAIAILPDQEPEQDHGVFAPFFGTPAYTMTFLSNLAKRTGAPVVFTAVQRLPKGNGYRIHYFKPDNGLYSDDDTVCATALNQCVERCIDVAPEQYMWNYKRFKKHPKESPPRYS